MATIVPVATSPGRSWSRNLLRGALVASVVGGLGAVGAGCLSRPVSTLQPVTKTNFTASVKQSAVDKVDILFMIDNSQSMGDKQEILIAAVPDLVTALVQPSCVDDTTGNVIGNCTPDAMGDCTCTTGKIEFPPVHDMHIGIVTSSLGGRASDACPEPTPNPVNGSVDTHNNDNGELINRSDPMNTQAESAVSDANGNCGSASCNFLAWIPPVAANTGKAMPPVAAIASSTTLISDFQDLVSGVHQYGCGFEAQDEAWYRFLVQPDPYDHVSRDQGECMGGAATGMITNSACLVGVDTTILQQRADFLRPDSLLAVIVVSDENSGEVVDPLSIGGQGWAYMDDHFPGGPGSAAMGTSACGPTPVAGTGLAMNAAGNSYYTGSGVNAGPLSPNCTSCGFSNSAAVVADKAANGNCSMNGGYYTQAQDQLNTRGVYDKQRFGVDPRFPVQRYINGLSANKVPDRNGEHSGGNYVGTPDCSNPIFSTNLPTSSSADLCNLTKGPRTSDLVFLAVITGVPHQLLQAVAGKDPECSPPNVPAGTAQKDCPQKASLTAADWTLMLGNDPENYDFTGISPYMFVSINPRMGLQPPGAGDGTDPVNGREWNTNAADQQYACTFPLAAPRDCTMITQACDCTMGRCDSCAGNANCVCPPLCGDGSSAPLTTQVRAKAYPSPRELEEAKGLGTQGIVSSLCPIHTSDNATMNDPLYGYRPAVAAIVDRLKNALASQCLPQQLTPDPTCGDVQCLILETLATGSQSDCSSGKYAGLSSPDPDVLSKFQASQSAAWAANGGADAGLGPDPSTLPTCQVTQLVPQSFMANAASCTNTTTPPSYTVTNNGVTTTEYAYDAFQGGTCAASTQAGWCYVSGSAAGGSCPQAILVSPGGNPQVGAQINLECIVAAPQPSVNGGAGEDGGT